MRMDPEDVRKLIKRVCIIGSFFVIAFVFYFLGRDGSGFWRGLLVVYALFVTLIMVLAVLLQSGRGGGLAGMGGAGGESVLGARAATPIAKATYVLGTLLLFICMLAARLGHETGMAPTLPVGDIEQQEIPEGTVPEEPPVEEPPVPDNNNEESIDD